METTETRGPETMLFRAERVRKGCFSRQNRFRYCLGACRKILFRFRKAPESPLLLRKSVSKAVKKREIARFSFRGFPHDHMKDHNDDHMKNGGRKSKFHISGCSPVDRAPHLGCGACVTASASSNLATQTTTMD